MKKSKTVVIEKATATTRCQLRADSFPFVEVVGGVLYRFVYDSSYEIPSRIFRMFEDRLIKTVNTKDLGDGKDA